MPREGGVKRRAIEQLAPTLIDEGQAEAARKSVGLAPESDTPRHTSGSAPVFVIVKGSGALAMPAACAAKVTALGETAYGGGMASPDNAADCEAAPNTVTSSESLFCPAEIGVKAILIVQLPPIGTETPQLLVCVKSSL